MALRSTSLRQRIWQSNIEYEQLANVNKLANVDELLLWSGSMCIAPQIILHIIRTKLSLTVSVTSQLEIRYFK